MSPTVARLRTYALLPDTAAAVTLEEHLIGAERDVTAATGRTDAPVGRDDQWEEVILLKAQRRLWPLLYPLDDGYARRDQVWQRREEALMATLTAPATAADGVPWMSAL